MKSLNLFISFYGLFLSLLIGCGSTSPNTGAATGANSGTSALYFTGQGGSGMRLGILVPQSRGIDEHQAYLSTLVQGILVTNIAKYSAISVLDRVAMDKVIAETLDPAYEDNFDIVRLGHVAQVGYMMTGEIIRTSTGYSLQINVTDTTPNAKTIASYSGTCTVAQLDDHSAIKKASAELLGQMGVQLTENAKNELNAGTSQQSINAQASLAQGIVAQRQGTEVAALSYYFQANTLDPSLAEAASRSSIITANISGSSIGQNTRSDIEWRRQWVARLTETEEFFHSLFNKTPVPYTLFYSTEIIPGPIDYASETQTLSIKTNLRAFGPYINSVERALQEVYNGFNATGRSQTWGLGSWPQQSITNLRAFDSKTENYNIVAELINSRGEIIGRTEFRASSTLRFFSGAEASVSNDMNQVSFRVKADGITDRLSIRMASVNGIPAETAARSGLLQIMAIPQQDWDTPTLFTMTRDGTLTGYNGNNKNLVIPNTIWNEPVAAIGTGAFKSKGLTSVTIPDSVTVIGDEAFMNNPLTNVKYSNNITTIGAKAFYGIAFNKEDIRIPPNVTSIGDWAYYGNNARSVWLPDSVRIIGYGAFRSWVTPWGRITSVSKIRIGANVTIGNSAFDGISIGPIGQELEVVFLFNDKYTKGGSKAGTYKIYSLLGLFSFWKYTPD
ncbi:MAG: leucine-rich repeat domain-containing protein [Treponema sp.]|nr:leucine-rich repeat domain-containing protein [Treponema sp.]